MNVRLKATAGSVERHIPSPLYTLAELGLRLVQVHAVGFEHLLCLGHFTRHEGASSEQSRHDPGLTKPVV